MGYSKKDKILARREFLTKLGVLSSLPILESLSLSGDVLAQANNAKKCKRLIVVSQPHMAGRHRIPDLARGDFGVSSSKFLRNLDTSKLLTSISASKHCLASSINRDIVPKHTILGITSSRSNVGNTGFNQISSIKAVGTKRLKPNVVLYTKLRSHAKSEEISRISLSQSIYTENFNQKRANDTFGVTSAKRLTIEIKRGQLKHLLTNPVHVKQKRSMVNTKNLSCFQS